MGIGILAIILNVYWQNKNKPICKNCNILLISIDTLSAKHLPCYGYNKNTAPNLCNFGKNNILFSKSYSQSYWTLPSQTSVFTGLHVTTHGIMAPFIDKLDKKYKTIQEELKNNGYTTYYFGPFIDNTSWNETVIRDYDFMEDKTYKDSNWLKALDILAENKKNNKATFMYLHTYYVHIPYTTRRENLKFVDKNNLEKYPEIPLTISEFLAFSEEKRQYVTKRLEERIENSNTSESLNNNLAMLEKIKQAKDLNEANIVFNNFPEIEVRSFNDEFYFASLKKSKANDYIASLYDERINQLDTEIKTFLDRIEKDFNKDTIVIFFADHGETLGQRGSYGHCVGLQDCLYNEILEVPLIIKVPGLKPKKIDELVQGIDIYPTILGLIGVTSPEYIEGEDLTKLMTGKQNKVKKEFIVSEDSEQQAVITDKKWSLYLKNLYDPELKDIALYDLENDKNQLSNVAEKYPNIVAEKINYYKEFRQKNTQAKQREYNFPAWLDEIKKQKLINEGYF